MDDHTLTPCQFQSKSLAFNLPIAELEHGSVIYSPTEEKSFWTIFTLVMSLIGIILSAVALAMLILTALMFSEWRKSYKNQLLIQLMIARFLYTSVRFFGDIQNVYHLCPNSENLIILDLVTMIYTEMALVAWMFVFSRQIYISLVKVFTSESWALWKVSLCAWLGPAIVATILFVMFHVGDSATRKYIMLFLVFIKWPMLIANAVMLILALRSVLKNNMRTQNNSKIIVVMIMLIFLFCFQQMIIDLCKLVFYEMKDHKYVINIIIVVSNIFAMYHCAFSIAFWLFGNASTRKLWRFQGKYISGKLRLSISS